MSRKLFVSSLVLLSVLLFACNIEKRKYRSGYYFSTAKSEKRKQLYEFSEYKSHSSKTKVEHIDVLTQDESPIPIPAKEISPKSKTVIAQPSEKSSKLVNIFKKKGVSSLPQPSDEDEVKKDVWMLFWGSIAAMLLSVLYGIFFSLNLTSLVSIVFILVPFSIIGLWIWSLLLKNKYSTETYPDDTEKKKETVYSQKKAFLLAGFLGIFGAHRFYLGYPKMGLLEMFTLGGFFVLFFIDLIRIKYGKLKPFDGKYEKIESTYSRGKKHVIKNKTMIIIKWSLAISVLALLLFIGLAILL